MDRIDARDLKIAKGAGVDFSLWDFLHCRAEGPELALAYSSVFWPDLIEVDGLVLVKENYDVEYFARVAADCSREKIEATINTTYLQDLFGADARVADEKLWTALGEILRDCWKARAEAQFPGREFVSTFAWYSDDSDPGVTIYQKCEDT